MDRVTILLYWEPWKSAQFVQAASDGRHRRKAVLILPFRCVRQIGKA